MSDEKMREAIESYKQLLNSEEPNVTFDVIGVKKEHLKELIENYTPKQKVLSRDEVIKILYEYIVNAPFKDGVCYLKPTLSQEEFDSLIDALLSAGTILKKVDVEGIEKIIKNPPMITPIIDGIVQPIKIPEWKVDNSTEGLAKAITDYLKGE